MRRLDGTEGRKGKTRKRDSTMDTVISANSGDTRQSTVSRQQQCATTADSGGSWQSRALKRVEVKQGQEENKESTR